MNITARLYDTFDTDATPVVGFLRWLADHRALPGSLHILDIGAGTGRLIPHLTALDWHVTATEPDTDYRDHLVAIAEAEGAEVTPETFNSLDHEEAFDLAIAVNGAFAHVTTPEERIDALRRLHRALRPGGILFLDLPNFLWILKHYRQPEAQERQWNGQEIRLVRHHEIDYDRATFTTNEEYTVAGSNGAEETVWKRHTYAMTAPPDLIRLMEEAGFHEIEKHTGVRRARGRTPRRGTNAANREAPKGPRTWLTVSIRTSTCNVTPKSAGSAF